MWWNRSPDSRVTADRLRLPALLEQWLRATGKSPLTVAGQWRLCTALPEHSTSVVHVYVPSRISDSTCEKLVGCVYSKLHANSVHEPHGRIGLHELVVPCRSKSETKAKPWPKSSSDTQSEWIEAASCFVRPVALRQFSVHDKLTERLSARMTRWRCIELIADSFPS
jgi:hypothetical protein